MKTQTLDHLEDNIRRFIADGGVRSHSNVGKRCIENGRPGLDYISQPQWHCSYAKTIIFENVDSATRLSFEIKNSCQSNNTSLLYCNLKLYTLSKTPHLIWMFEDEKNIFKGGKMCFASPEITHAEFLIKASK
ncbi:hypothetical protein TNCV_3543631 [Trichonephila clavipes]|nr:hypothetical protein TNCV_3543631 [Trichonephila clavipes]